MPPKMLLALPLVSALPAASTAFERPPKAAERAGSSATSALFLSRVSDSRQSSVSAAALPMVSLPPAIALAKSEYSKRPSRMAATMSGPARRPKTSAPIAMAAVADFAALIFSMYFGSAFCGSRPSLAKVLSANFMPVSTVLVLTPSLLPLGEHGDRVGEAEAHVAQRRAELDHRLHEVAHADARLLRRAKEHVEGARLILGGDRPVAEEARAEAHVLGDVAAGEAAELEELLGERLQRLAGEPEAPVQLGDRRTGRGEVGGHARRPRP